MSDINASAPAILGPNGELMVTYFMEKKGIDRDPAIGGLMDFASGKGQPWVELFVEFPELAVLYFHNLGLMRHEESVT